MRFCPRCRGACAEGTRFCPVCATPLTSEFVAAAAPEVSPAAEGMRRCFRSGLFLAAAILLSLELVLSLISLVLYLFPVEEAQLRVISYTVGGGLMMILPVIGMWMIFAAARRRGKHYMEDRGFALISALCVIALVGVSVISFITAAAAVTVFFGMISGKAEYFIEYLSSGIPELPRNTAAAVMYAGVFLGVILLVFAILFLVKLIRGISVIRAAARRGRVKGQLSPVVVIGFGVLSIGYALSWAAYMGMGAYLSASCDMLTAAACVCLLGVSGLVRRELAVQDVDIPPERTLSAEVSEIRRPDPYVQIER